MVKHPRSQVDLLTVVALFSLGKRCYYPKVLGEKKSCLLVGYQIQADNVLAQQICISALHGMIHLQNI